jgi:hypothetical protein
MKKLFEIFFLVIIISASKSLPHFIYDGIESFRDCSQETEEISFSIYGTLSEEIADNMKIENYFLEDMGDFQCLLKKNENSKNKNRQHKIFCSIKGSFERKGYILEEPKVSGFDFKKENGETSWPKVPESKTFLIGKCGKKIEIDNEPLLTLTSTEYSNPLETVRKGTVDQAIAGLPKRSSTTLNNMCAAMKSAKQSYSLSEAESAYLVYKWLGQNIVYDCYALNHGGIDHSGSGTYSKGKGVCSGYAELFETMCDYLGLDSEYVVGYSKGAGFTPGVIPTRSDHAWNAVKIGSSYYLIDITWGAGSCDGDSYIANYKDFYYCTNPEAFIRTHLPEEQQWQLISPTINLETFVNMLKLEEAFYSNGFTSISPDAPSFSSKGGFKITFTYDDTENIALLNNIYLLQGNTYYQQSNACFYTKGDGVAEITCVTNYQGQYMLRIFGGPAGSESYPQLVEYTIQSTQTAEIPLGFPTVYGLYSNSDTQLLEPLYCPLTKGALYNFRITSTTFSNLHLIIGDNHFYELDNDGNGLFTGDDVYIHGDRVALVTLNNNQYQFILQYTTANDPNNPEEPTFPNGYSAPKNVLYSPLTDTLRKGQSYLFKIKCESANDMIVVDGNNIIHLDKDGSMFSKTITINGSSGKVQLASYANRSYQTFYYYFTS